jgi:hypothetical protein
MNEAGKKTPRGAGYDGTAPIYDYSSAPPRAQGREEVNYP